MLIFGRKKTAWFKNDHVTSVLECSSNLGGIQGKQKIGFTISSLGFRVILNSAKAKENLNISERFVL